MAVRPAGHLVRAQRLLDEGNKAGAVTALLAAVEEFPECGDLHANICSLLCDLGHWGAAVGAGFTAIEHDPGNGRAQSELGRALFLAGKSEEALAHCARAVLLVPDNMGAVVTLAATLFTLGKHEEALEAAEQAVAIDPRHFQARVNLALIHEALGRLDDAEAQSRLALRLDPDNVVAQHNLAALRLACGKLDGESWRLYESRLGLTAQSRKLAGIVRWGGEDVAGRTVLLHAEQGFGDVIQFVRYAPMVQGRGARVILAVQAGLTRLLTGLRGVDEIVTIGETLPRYDVFCPLASLPGVFGTTVDTIPAPVPYLAASSDAIARFGPKAGIGMQVGLVWAGNPEFRHDLSRSIRAEALNVLSDVPGVCFHSLQMGTPAPFRMQDRMPEVADFADTAGIVAGLDLVIAADTGVAHLAGAMGRPVWLLSRFMGCWRWMRDRDDSPWYPTMRIFRQSRPRDWDGVLLTVRGALVEAAARHRDTVG